MIKKYILSVSASAVFGVLSPAYAQNPADMIWRPVGKTPVTAREATVSLYKEGSQNPVEPESQTQGSVSQNPVTLLPIEPLPSSKIPQIPKGKVPYVVGGNSLSLNKQTVPRPPAQPLISCKWDDKDGGRFLCLGSQGGIFTVYMKDNAGWSDDVYTIINNAPAILLNPQAFIYNPATNHFEPNPAGISKPAQSMAAKPPKDGQYAVTAPKSLTGAQLIDLKPGEFKPIPNTNPLALGMQLSILNKLRPVVNNNGITFAGGAPLPYHMFTVQPKYVDFDMPFSDPAKKYAMNFKDGRELPKLYMRDVNGKSHLAIALSVPPLTPYVPNMQSEGRMIMQDTPAGPGAEQGGAPTNIPLSQEIANALRNGLQDGTVTWQIYLELYSRYFTGDGTLNRQVIPITNKDLSQIGFVVALPHGVGSRDVGNYIMYVFKDDKGRDGVLDTLHMYTLNQDGTIKKEIKVQPPAPKK